MKKFFLLLFVIPFGALAQKELSVTSTPADADIYNLSLGTAPVKAGTGTIKLKLEKDKPVVLEARKEGFVPVQKTFLRKKLRNSLHFSEVKSLNLN